MSERDQERSGEDEKGNPGNPDMGESEKVEPAPGKPDTVIHKPKLPRKLPTKPPGQPCPGPFAGFMALSGLPDARPPARLGGVEVRFGPDL